MNLMSERTYTLLGNPIPLARARHANNRVYDSQKAQKLAAGIFLSRQHQNGPLFVGPLEVEIEFLFAYPKSRKCAPFGCPSLPHYIRPDIDNCIKWCLDIAIGILYHDDCIISSLIAKKMYCERGDEKTVFTIRELK